MKIMQAGAVDPLLQMARDGSPSAKEVAARALWVLADNANNSSVVTEMGGVTPLVNISREGTAGARHNGTGGNGRLTHALHTRSEGSGIKSGSPA